MNGSTKEHNASKNVSKSTVSQRNIRNRNREMSGTLRENSRCVMMIWYVLSRLKTILMVSGCWVSSISAISDGSVYQYPSLKSWKINIPRIIPESLPSGFSDTQVVCAHSEWFPDEFRYPRYRGEVRKANGMYHSQDVKSLKPKFLKSTHNCPPTILWVVVYQWDLW